MYTNTNGLYSFRINIVYSLASGKNYTNNTLLSMTQQIKETFIAGNIAFGKKSI